MQQSLQQGDIKALAARVIERVERNRRHNTAATDSDKPMQQTALKKDLKVASEKALQKTDDHKPKLVAHNERIQGRGHRNRARIYRIEVDGKKFTFIDQNHTDDVRGLMVRKFGSGGRVGAITSINVPGSSGEPS